MNTLLSRPIPLGEELLISTAIRIELPISLHDLAVQRYEAVQKHIERQSSPLYERVKIFYPQGSMAVGATIKSRKRSEGYDIDIVAELLLPPSTKPSDVLDLLYLAIKGDKGSQYYDMVERQTRCVTIYYADGMHLDVTPTILIEAKDPRLSYLFHAKKSEPEILHKRLEMNSYAFCEWFKKQTPIDMSFEEAYKLRVKDYNKGKIIAEADVEPVPAHSSKQGGKSAFVVALQLLKRNRNINYEKRGNLRLPPSVMMARIAADVAITNVSLNQALKIISSQMLEKLEAAHNKGLLIDICNPCCNNEKYTDRWPENSNAQWIYIADLKKFIRQLEELMQEGTLAKKQSLLSDMFGEEPARLVLEDYNYKIGSSIQDGTRRISSTGQIALPSLAVSTIITPSSALAKPPQHTFFGTKWGQQ